MDTTVDHFTPLALRVRGKYVPITSTTEMVMDPHIGSQIPVEKDLFHRILFGGDMLTTKMARIALHIRENSNRGKVCLEQWWKTGMLRCACYA